MRLPSPALLLIALLTTGAPGGFAHSSTPAPPSGTPPREDGSVPQEALTLAAPDLDANPALIEAAKTRPLPPESLERLLPAKMAGLARASSNKKLQQVGPAMLTYATAQYGELPDRTIELKILDPGGLDASSELLPLPAAGELREFAGRTVHREEIAGFPAAVAPGQDGLPSLVQVSPGGRILVLLSAYGVAPAELVKAAGSVDLPRLAALAGK